MLKIYYNVLKDINEKLKKLCFWLKA